MRRLLAIGAYAGAALTLCPAPSRGQILLGQVVEERTGAPVAGAVAALLDREGGVLVQAVSDSAGGFRLVPPAAGEHFVTVERYGYDSVRSPLLSLDPSERAVRLEFQLRPQPIGLDGIEVSVEREAAEFLVNLGHTPASLGSRWIDREAIEAMPLPVGPREVIRWRGIAGVWVDEGSGGLFDGLCVEFTRSAARGCAIVLLNGVEISGAEAQQLSPAWIESIALLSPIDATTFLGARAVNGAVFIWTRRGR